ncbi:MAG: response regulator [Acidobacteria bacterium]|nr:response regulator [Acidobacteriaceae bacterium]MBV9609493.1 response regulator [Acidobacteriota bacterium]
MPRTQKTVLLIDDEQNALSGWSLYLQGCGYKVANARTPQEGLEFFATKTFVDAVVLDYRMPEMDGDEVAAYMKRIKPEVVILMFSGDIDASRKHHPSIDAFMIKGESPAHLLSTLDRLLGIPEGSSTGAA